MEQQIVIFKLPGFVDRFKAELIPGLHLVPSCDDGREVSVVLTEAGETLAVNSRNVFTPEGLAYAEDWAARTHQSVFDIYIPEALRLRGTWEDR